MNIWQRRNPKDTWGSQSRSVMIFSLILYLICAVGNEEWTEKRAHIKMPCNNLNRLVVTRKSQTSACRIVLAIARSIRQSLSFRFSCNDLTLGYQVVSNTFVVTMMCNKLKLSSLASLTQEPSELCSLFLFWSFWGNSFFRLFSTISTGLVS